jgi:hypothetical protein
LNADQLVLPPGITILIEPGETIVTIVAPRAAEEDPAAASDTPA